MISARYLPIIMLLFSFTNTFSQKDTIAVKSTKQITGTWMTVGKERLTLRISEYIFLYAEHHEPHKYELNNDSIYIHYLDGILEGRPYLVNDTLFISTTNGQLKYVRRK